MPTLTRRDWVRIIGGGLLASPVACLADREEEAGGSQEGVSIVAGVRIGAQSYSFRDRPLREVPAAYEAAGISFCELWSGHVEAADITGATREMPPETRRARLREWRLRTPLSHFAAIRQRFLDAGVTITSYDVPYRGDWTDDEIARSFEIAKALGAVSITSSAVLSAVPQVAPHAARANMPVSFHNHSILRDDEFATPDDFAAAMQISPLMGVTLDIGHFTAAGFDPVSYIAQHHDRVRALHVKDRRRDQGPATPFGEGDTPVAGVLRLLRDRRWDIPAHIEYEYQGGDAVEEVKKCYAWCRQALAG